MFCEKCGEKIKASQLYCEKCGARVSKNSESSVQEVKRSSKFTDIVSGFTPNNKWIYTVGIMMVLIAGVFYILNRSHPSISEIKEELAGKTVYSNDLRYEITADNLKRVKVVDRETIRKNEVEAITIDIEMSDDSIQVNGQVQVRFSKQKYGWIITDGIEIPTAHGTLLVFKPLTGVSEARLKEMITGESIDVSERDVWKIDEVMEIADIRIEKSDTKLEEKIDTTDFEVTLQSDVAKVTSKLKAESIFQDGGWRLKSLSRLDEQALVYAFIPENEPPDDAAFVEIMKPGIKNIRGYKTSIEDRNNITITTTEKTFTEKGMKAQYTFQMKLENETISANGACTADLYFEDGIGWQLEEGYLQDSFTVNWKPVAEEKIKKDLIGEEFRYGGLFNSWEIEEGEIREFSIQNIENENDGEQIIFTNISLTGGGETIKGQLRIKYKYDGVKMELISASPVGSFSKAKS